jgi:hypothetical protein
MSPLLLEAAGVALGAFLFGVWVTPNFVVLSNRLRDTPAPTPDPNLPRLQNSPLVTVVIVVAALWGYHKWFHTDPPAPTPYVTPMARVTKDYMTTFPQAFRVARDGVRSGSMKGKGDVVKSLAGHAAAFSKAMDDSFAPFVDASTGVFVNSAGAADLLDQVATAMGGK